ncbi:PAS domain-containing methyl-accepting chemotaxis protein [Thalassospira sp. TSL5-1]|uniref:methyl-accepting chemotaxis protein n=1 Tax=Thalassospira sp. TSL5-1 TaxID=1544451 RepID=UPI00093DAE69|nr:PAS domain-containing methyl-accepting chemotaxis protein [Thalassospira sp. TSL5-1]OKH87217.1 chemotaxis protein [Thalassospira sp. TSL5-1]
MVFSRIFRSSKAQDASQVLDALTLSMASIEFSMDGEILTANENFLAITGYTLAEIVGKSHSIFVPREERETPEYKNFWKKLRNGEFQRSAFRRVTKTGEDVWLEASYNPVFDRRGVPVKVIKFATDITERRQERAVLQGVYNAISKAQALIEFDLDGKILTANQNFLDVFDYRLKDIEGKHHSMFVDVGVKDTREYADFWRALKQGTFQQGQYKRIGKNRKVVWIEASYNPILDPMGKPFKVIKFATDVTEQVNLLIELKAMIDNNFSEIDNNIAVLGDTATDAVMAATNTSETVHTVATSAEQLAASIAEISRSMAQSRSATEQVFEQTVAADSSTQRMSQVVAAMGNIVEVIQDIAGQINLLALNATIESARAGDAGKGFAVVANEVKNLANQAARATDQIAEEISGIQSITTEVVDALGTIRNSVEMVRDSVANISSAVEEQSAVTDGVSDNIQSMRDTVEAVSRNIGDIQKSAGSVATAVNRTREAAEILAR